MMSSSGSVAVTVSGDRMMVPQVVFIFGYSWIRKERSVGGHERAQKRAGRGRFAQPRNGSRLTLKERIIINMRGRENRSNALALELHGEVDCIFTVHVDVENGHVDGGIGEFFGICKRPCRADNFGTCGCQRMRDFEPDEKLVFDDEHFSSSQRRGAMSAVIVARHAVWLAGAI